VIHRFRGVAAFTALGLILTACGGGTSRTTGGGGGQLIMANVKDATTLDPAHATDGISLNATAEIMENLVTFKAGSFEIIPALATKWSSNGPGMKWTFTLRDGAKFSDGTPADAVRARQRGRRSGPVSSDAAGHV